MPAKKPGITQTKSNQVKSDAKAARETLLKHRLDDLLYSDSPAKREWDKALKQLDKLILALP